MTNNKLTDERLTEIIKSAEAVITALAGTNDDVHPNNSTEMCRLYDWLNDNDAPPEVVLAMAKELQERRKADNNERQPSPVLMWLSESYLVHLVSLHRRPVFRHENGDIMLSCQTIACFVDGYFAERRTLAYRQYLYAKLLILDKSNESGYLAHFGETPRLKPRGIRLLNAMFNRFGFMIEEFGGCENLLKHMDKEIAGGNHVK